MKRTRSNSDVARPTARPAPSSLVANALPAELWKIIGKVALVSPTKRTRDLSLRDTTTLRLINRSSAEAMWRPAYFLAAMNAFHEASDAFWMARTLSHKRIEREWVPVELSILGLTTLKTAWCVHFDMLKGMKNALKVAILSDDRALCKGIIATIRYVRDDRKVVDRIYAIGSTAKQLDQRKILGYPDQERVQHKFFFNSA
tara:strand:- start:164 stop:766 length:603 start_codon:yes stop_codon:yes gene_type:complete